jgi:FkbM family methyltransferase
MEVWLMRADSFVVRLLRGALRRRVRGSTRAALLLSRVIPGWRAVEVPVGDESVFIDLSEASSHGLFAGLLPEVAERAFVRTHVQRGETVLDVGAHWGLYTVETAARVGPEGRVFAFEPCPTVLPCLTRTVARLPNVTLIAAAVSDCSASATLAVPPDASMASLADGTATAGLRTFKVNTVTIDTLLEEGMFGSADFVKCDVEGAEAMVFRGAASLLDRPDAPVVMLEVNARAAAALGLPATAALDVLAGFTRAGYVFYSLSAAGRLESLPDDPERAWNVFAVSEDRRSWIDA